MIAEQERERVHIMFAVQAIEAWIFADEGRLNDYLGMNKARRENDPEKIDFPKQKLQSLFTQCRKHYDTQVLLELLPILQLECLMRCKHFKQLYDCVKNIVEEK